MSRKTTKLEVMIKYNLENKGKPAFMNNYIYEVLILRFNLQNQCLDLEPCIREFVQLHNGTSDSFV